MPRVRALRSPLLHFVILGWIAFATQGLWSDAADANLRGPIVVPAAEVARIRELAQRETGRPPSERELDLRVAAWIDDELLLREARAMGWHRTDPVVHMRLAQNLRFLGEGEEVDDAALVDRAYEMGMDESDVVVRRRLLERMRLAITSAAVAEEPPDDTLGALLAEEPERYRRPPLVKLRHVFLSRDRRGPALADDARALLARLQREGIDADAARGFGDPSLIPADLPLSSERALAARLGPEFAARAIALQPGDWRGPIPSAYGEHLVWVERRIEAYDPDVAEARRELLATWRTRTEREALRRAIEQLRASVEIRVETPAAG